MFNFNRMCIQDPTVPMWVIKHRGLTYYVDHMDVMPGVGFSTKETPENPHTKGSLKIKGKLTIIQEDQKIVATVE